LHRARLLLQDLLKKMKLEHKSARQSLEAKAEEEEDDGDESKEGEEEDEEGEGSSAKTKLARMMAKHKTETE